MTTEEGLAVMELLTYAYPKADIPTETVMLYIKCMSDIPFDTARIAVMNHITEKNFFPSIAELRQAALTADPHSYLPDAAVAWSEVMTQLRESGFEAPRFSHPAIGAAVKTIGWRNLCNSHEIGVDRAHFLKIYETYRGRCYREMVNLPRSAVMAIGMQDNIAELPQAVQMINSVAKSKGA